MPAIHLARLKLQSAALSQFFEQPAAFLKELKNLLEFYANRTHRPGQTGEPQPLLPSYNVPGPILNQIYLDLKPLVIEKPDESLELCEALWQEPYLECRMLSARLLGQISPAMTSEIFAHLQVWLPDTREERLIDTLLDFGLARLRTEYPDLVLDQIKTWLEDDRAVFRRFGLRAMLPILRETSFDNLPFFYRLLTPYFRQTPNDLRPDVLRVLTALTRRSPQEMAFMLRQNLGVSGHTDTAWLIRQVIKEFPQEQQSSLRAALRENKRSA